MVSNSKKSDFDILVCLEVLFERMILKDYLKVDFRMLNPPFHANAVEEFRIVGDPSIRLALLTLLLRSLLRLK